jgi:hypothetical protein
MEYIRRAADRLPRISFLRGPFPRKHISPKKRKNEIRGNITRGNEIRGNVTRENEIRGNVTRGNEIRGNVLRRNEIQGNVTRGNEIRENITRRNKNLRLYIILKGRSGTVV